MINAFITRAIQLVALAIGLASMAAAAPSSAGLTGKWSGTVDVHDTSSGSVISTPIEVHFEEPQPGVIAGKIGREGETDATAIRNGKLEGGRLSFEAASSETSGAMKFILLLEGDHLEGQMKGAVESQDIEGTVKLSRETK